MKGSELGWAYERWCKDVLDEYARVRGTGRNEHFDLVIENGMGSVLFECKCFRFRKGEAQDENCLCLRPTQVDRLKDVERGLHGRNEVLFLVGVYFPPGDVLPFVISLEDILRLGRWKDKRGRMWVKMGDVLKWMPLRGWMARRWKLDPLDVEYPEFRLYLRGDR